MREEEGEERKGREEECEEMVDEGEEKKGEGGGVRRWWMREGEVRRDGE